MTWKDIDTVLLVGGSTECRWCRRWLPESAERRITPREVNPDEAVALGAAIQGTLRQIETGPVKQEDLSEAVLDRFIGPGRRAQADGGRWRHP